MDTAPLRIELFGGLRVRQGERTITRFPTRKAAALLAYLAFYRAVLHSREALFELLWPECAPMVGRNRLSTLLSLLRTLLEPPGTPAGTVLYADRLTVQLRPDAFITDVAEFETLLYEAQHTPTSLAQAALLQRAVALYQGDLLTGYYGDWITQEQARLSERYGDALEQLERYLERAGDWKEALTIARRAVQADPFREESHRAMMRLHAALGRPMAALEDYHALERLLQAEMNVAPSAEMRYLAELLLHNPFALVCERRKSDSAP